MNRFLRLCSHICRYLDSIMPTSITFGSVGDIISVCRLAKQILLSLDESRGSVREYEILSGELHSLETALLEAALVAEKHQHTTPLLTKAIIEEAMASRNMLDEFRTKYISKYDAAFKAKSPMRTAKSLARSVQWRLVERDTISQFRAAISTRLNALSMLLITANV